MKIFNYLKIRVICLTMDVMRLHITWQTLDFYYKYFSDFPLDYDSPSFFLLEMANTITN